MPIVKKNLILNFKFTLCFKILLTKKIFPEHFKKKTYIKFFFYDK